MSPAITNIQSSPVPLNENRKSNLCFQVAAFEKLHMTIIGHLTLNTNLEFFVYLFEYSPYILA